MLLTSGSQHPIGLDISDLSLKLIQLKKTGDKIAIQAVSKIDLPAGLIEDGEIKNRPELIKALKTLVEKPKYGQVTSQEVTACLPENKTFLKLIEVGSGPNDLAEVIKAEIEKSIPLPLDEMHYDWQLIEQRPDSNLILVGAAPRSIVDDYSSLLDECGLTAFALEIESSAICRALLAEERPKAVKLAGHNYAILDIGAKRTSMIVYASNTPLFSVSLPISGEAVTQNIADSLKIERDQAEQAKIICGLDEEKAQGVIKEILSSLINDLTKKIKEVITYYHYHFPNQGPLSQILLCGGGASVDNMNDRLTADLGIPVVLADSLTNLQENREKINQIFSETYRVSLANGKKKPEADLSLSQNSSLAFATAIGLALRGIFVDEI